MSCFHKQQQRQGVGTYSEVRSVSLSVQYNIINNNKQGVPGRLVQEVRGDN